jgi:ketosteroid isomerase-like protein
MPAAFAGSYRFAWNHHRLRKGTTMTAQTSTTAQADVQAVRSGFEAVAAGDLVAFAAGFHPEAIWNHRNPDRLGGIKHGIDQILRPVPELFMSDGAGHVAVLTRISGTRPDGRTFDDTQILYFQLEDELVRSVDQFIGDPAAVTAFWA